MSSTITGREPSLTAFSNEPVSDFSKVPEKQAMEQALKEGHEDLIADEPRISRSGSRNVSRDRAN